MWKTLKKPGWWCYNNALKNKGNERKNIYKEQIKVIKEISF
jgi:hypothetical protein